MHLVARRVSRWMQAGLGALLLLRQCLAPADPSAALTADMTNVTTHAMPLS